METRSEYSNYAVKTTGFEGPFALLLSLVEEKKLFINDISLAAVTEDYLKYVSDTKNMNPLEASSFLVVAATLILIKSKSLLPNLILTSEEEGDIKDLEERLRLYEIYSKSSLDVKKEFGRNMIFAPLYRKSEVLVFLPDERITRDSMMAFAKDALGRIPVKISLPEVEVRKVISIEEMIDKLTERIQTSLQTSFKSFSGVSGTPANREEKVMVIVSFLAMLELVRNGILDAVQGDYNSDIIISKQEEEAPQM